MVLREAGLVADRKDGVMVYYRLADGAPAGHPGPGARNLAGMGRPVPPPQIPAVPVPGCPCTRCGGEGTCAA
jgi:hypothetical protein